MTFLALTRIIQIDFNLQNNIRICKKSDVIFFTSIPVGSRSYLYWQELFSVTYHSPQKSHKHMPNIHFNLEQLQISQRSNECMSLCWSTFEHEYFYLWVISKLSKLYVI